MTIYPYLEKTWNPPFHPSILILQVSEYRDICREFGLAAPFGKLPWYALVVIEDGRPDSILQDETASVIRLTETKKEDLMGIK